MCTVPCVSRAGVVWAEGAQAVASLGGRVAAFRRWAEPGPGLRDADVLMPQAASQPLAVAGSSGSGGPAAGLFGGLLAGYRSHLCVVVSRKTACCACGRPSGSVPKLAVPRRGAGGKDPSFHQRRHSEVGRCGGQQRRPGEVQNPGRQSWRKPCASPLSCKGPWGRSRLSGSRFAPGQCFCGCIGCSPQGGCRVAGTLPGAADGLHRGC